MSPGALQLGALRVAVPLLLFAEWAGPTRPVHHLHDPQAMTLALVPWVGGVAMMLGIAARSSSAVVGLSVLAVQAFADPGLGGGGVGLVSAEALWLGLLALGLAFTPCGQALSVDASLGRPAAVDLGGRELLRAVASVGALGLVLGHAELPAWDGTRVAQLAVARLGLAHDALGGWAWPVAVGWRLAEVAAAVAPWLPRGRAPVLLALAVGALALYPLLYTGCSSWIAALALLAAIDPGRGNT